MKLARTLLLRLALLSLAAGMFVGLTGLYGGSVRLSLPNAHSQAERRHRRSAPEFWKFDEFFAAAGMVALWDLAGRIMLRLRLSPAPRNEGQPILLGLPRGLPASRSTGALGTGFAEL